MRSLRKRNVPFVGTGVYSPPHTLYAESGSPFEDAVARAALFSPTVFIK
jgi:hypothetical protein